MSPLTRIRQPNMVGEFTPTQIAGLKLWLRASSINLGAGDTIATWRDSTPSGNDVTQATGPNQPTYRVGQINGKPAVRCDGSNDLLANTMAIGATATVFVVAQFTGAYVAAATVIDDDAGNRMRLYRQSSTSMRASTVAELAITTTPQSPHIYSMIYTATGEFRVDGGGLQSGDISSTKEGLTIGALPGGTSPADVDVAEVLLYTRALGDSERRAVERYLGQIYGIVVA